jgi:hypothetical protein
MNNSCAAQYAYQLQIDLPDQTTHKDILSPEPRGICHDNRNLITFDG